GAADEVEDLRARALTWLRRAADLAIGRFEIEDGLALLQRALELETDPELRAPLWREVGRASILKYDGELFWTAMQNSLEGTTDRAALAETYAQLAFQTSLRGGMWKRRPDRARLNDWIERALELAEPDAPARARALITRAYEDPDGSEGALREATKLAEQLGDLELLSFAWDARKDQAFARGEYAEGLSWAMRRFELVPLLNDPDHVSLIYMYTLDPLIVNLRFDQARKAAEEYDAVTQRLSAHHRVHAASGFVGVEVASGHWEAVRDLTAWAESAVAANIATPCVLGVSMLLACALAQVHLGDLPEARRLEQAAADLGMEGYTAITAAPPIDIAMARGDLAEVEELLQTWRPDGLASVDDLITWLNALMALGRRAEIEAEAPALVKPKTYLEPFALRALGFARNDDGLIEQAIQRFEAMGLDWHATQTKKLLTPA
ncbi:MAG: hypothetical protein ACRDE9_01930, partial [Candidatus Limnocylindria bacterium]